MARLLRLGWKMLPPIAAVHADDADAAASCRKIRADASFIVGA